MIVKQQGIKFEEKTVDKEIMDISHNGIITTEEVNEAGLYRGGLKKLADNGTIYRYSRGIYLKSDAWEDDFFLLQKRYSRGIYSHDTALYLLGYSDRTPSSYTMTFPQGYNTSSLLFENIKIKRVIPEIYLLGITEVSSPSGNLIRIYNLERSLCDIVRGSGIDIQIINSAMKQYASSNNKDIHLLMQYAEKLHVKNKILRYMEVLL